MEKERKGVYTVWEVKKMQNTTLIYLEKDSQVLMLRKNAGANRGKWVGVGGHMEENESPWECVRREVMEETGLVLRSARFRGVVTFVSDTWEGEQMFLFTSRDFAGEIGRCDEGELKWTPWEEVLSLHLWEGDRIFLRLLKEDRDGILLKLSYRGDDLAGWELTGPESPAPLPEGFVYALDAVPGCLEDAKYAGCDNFMGRPARGYMAARVVVSRQVAQGLQRAQAVFDRMGYTMLLYDGYRPQRAVDDFVEWGKDVSDQRRKAIHYPRIDKADMFTLGYVAKKSGHSRGGAIDLTLIDRATGREADMDGRFDYMDPTSGYGAEGVSEAGQKNRKLLHDVMVSCGFRGISSEWWHFVITPEPYPDTYFDFPIA